MQYLLLAGLGLAAAITEVLFRGNRRLNEILAEREKEEVR